MKIKILKRILAAIVAVSTTMATSGVVGAISVNLEAYINSLENYYWNYYWNDVDELVVDAISPESEEYINNVENYYRNNGCELSEIIGRLGEISQEGNAAKVKIANVIRSDVLLMVQDSEYTHEQLLPFIDLLRECATADGAKETIADIIGLMPEIELLDGWSVEQLLPLTNILIECANCDMASQSAVLAMFVMAKRGFLKQYSHEQLLALTKRSMECAKDAMTGLYFAEFIGALAADDLLKEYSHEQLLQIINKLIERTLYNESEVAKTIGTMAQKGLLDGFKSQPNVLFKLAKTLNECSKGIFDSKSETLGAIEVFLGKDKTQNYRGLKEEADRQEVFNKLLEDSVLKDLSSQGKEELKEALDRCLGNIK